MCPGEISQRATETIEDRRIYFNTSSIEMPDRKHSLQLRPFSRKIYHFISHKLFRTIWKPILVTTNTFAMLATKDSTNGNIYVDIQQRPKHPAILKT